MKTRTLGFLGAGNMAGALIKGLLHAEPSPPPRIVASDVKPERLKQLESAHGIRTTIDNHALVRDVDVLVLAVKPQVVDKVLGAIGRDVKDGTLVSLGRRRRPDRGDRSAPPRRARASSARCRTRPRSASPGLPPSRPGRTRPRTTCASPTPSSRPSAAW